MVIIGLHSGTLHVVFGKCMCVCVQRSRVCNFMYIGDIGGVFVRVYTDSRRFLDKHKYVYTVFSPEGERVFFHSFIARKIDINLFVSAQANKTHSCEHCFIFFITQIYSTLNLATANYIYSSRFYTQSLTKA